MKTMIKDTVERLGGLQQKDWITYSIDSTTGQSDSTVWNKIYIGSGTDLINGGVLSGVSTSDDKVTLRYLELVVWFTNSSNSPVVFMYWDALARKTTTQDVGGLMNADGQVTNVPFGDMTRCSTFRRAYSIEKRGMRILKAGECIAIRTSRYFPGGKVIQTNVEGVQLANAGLTRVLMWQANSVPVMFKTTGGTFQTQVANICLNWVARQHYSYTKPQISNPLYIVAGSTPVATAPGCEVISNKVIAKAVDLYDNFI